MIADLPHARVGNASTAFGARSQSPQTITGPELADAPPWAIAGTSTGTKKEAERQRPKTDTEVKRTQDPQPSPETRTAEAGGRANEPFLQRLFEALFEEEPTGQGEAAQPRRLPPAPYQSPPFPFTEHLGPLLGIRDEAVWPLTEALENGPNGQFWKDSRLKIGSSGSSVRGA
jgi:hypothetical protein